MLKVQLVQIVFVNSSFDSTIESNRKGQFQLSTDLAHFKFDWLHLCGILTPMSGSLLPPPCETRQNDFIGGVASTHNDNLQRKWSEQALAHASLHARDHSACCTAPGKSIQPRNSRRRNLHLNCETSHCHRGATRPPWNDLQRDIYYVAGVKEKGKLYNHATDGKAAECAGEFPISGGIMCCAVGKHVQWVSMCSG
jgi:hypothetical protein